MTAAVKINRSAALDDRSRRILHERAVALAKTSASGQAQVEATLEFALGVERYALPLRQVAEIMRHANVTPIPGSASELAGAIFVRGEVYCVVDLAKILGAKASADAAGQRQGTETEADPGYIVLVWFSGQKIGLLVDTVRQVSMQAQNHPAVADRVNSSLNSNYSLGITHGSLIRLDLNAVFTHPVFASSR